uniref:Ig-like domain-containing protein n=1 Tax=Xenopus tropicalis TaxID=8364 RepID=A0A803KBU4_XENTR
MELANVLKDRTLPNRLDVIPALPGETITIPCYVHYPPGASERGQSVTWRKGRDAFCSYDQTLDTRDGAGRFSVMDSPTDVSLSINRVRREDSGYYCCIVGKHIESGTELVIEGNTISGSSGLQETMGLCNKSCKHFYRFIHLLKPIRRQK